MRPAAALLIAFLIAAALPLLLRIDSSRRSGRPLRALLDGTRLMLAIGAASILFLVVVRTR